MNSILELEETAKLKTGYVNPSYYIYSLSCSQRDFLKLTCLYNAQSHAGSNLVRNHSPAFTLLSSTVGFSSSFT
jgi:hypothetical protein